MQIASSKLAWFASKLACSDAKSAFICIQSMPFCLEIKKGKLLSQTGLFWEKRLTIALSKLTWFGSKLACFAAKSAKFASKACVLSRNKKKADYKEKQAYFEAK